MERAPLYDDIADGPPGGAAYWLTTDDGLRIRIGVWSPVGEARGTILIFPGRTEYVEKYGCTALDLTRAGYAAVTVDWRGQGLADRLLDNRAVGHVLEFSDYQRDIAAMLDAVRQLDLPYPLQLVAHSMGGCIGLRALIEGLPVRSACFTAPMWGIRMVPALRPVAWGLSTLSRPLRFSHIFAPGQVGETYVLLAPFEGNTLTTDPGAYARLKRQLTARPDLALGGPSLHWLGEALREMRHLAPLPSPPVPTLTLMGSNERIVEPGRISHRMAHWRGGRLLVLSGGEHEVMMERAEIRNVVFDAMLAHFDHTADLAPSEARTSVA